MKARAHHVLLVALALAAASAGAQDYPLKPVRFVVPFPPGGNTDILARTLANGLSAAWKQQLVIENRAGAGGGIGTEIVAKSPPDGYTILLGTIGSLAINPSIYPNLPYDPLRDLAPVTWLSSNPLMVLVHPSLPAKNLRQLVDLAKARPNELKYGSGGAGTSTHLSVELFKSMVGVSLVHVPFRGAPLAAISMMTGEISLMFDNLAPSLPHVRSGRMRALAVTSAQRSTVVPELPTVQEAGVAGYEVTGWYGVLAPAGIPGDIVKKLHADIVRTLATRDVTARLRADGADPVGSTPEEFRKYIQSETRKWADVIRKSGARVD